MRLLLFILALVSVVWLLKGVWRQRVSSGQTDALAGQAQPASQAEEPPPTTGDNLMISCAFCGLHIPQAEAITSHEGHTYCCEAHRIRHLKNQ